MKKKLMIILVMAFLAGITGVNAQVVNNDITTEDTEEFETEDEDEDEDEDEKTEGEMKAVNTILIGRIAGEFKLQPDGYWENTIVHATVNNGEETVHFVTVRFRGKQAELAYTHLSKGDLCCIEGRRGEETTDTGVVKEYIEAGHITFLAAGRRNNA